MRRKRGLKRYYRNLSKIGFIDNLDFTDSEDSWFDFYHIHIDNTGLGNRSWKSRLQHLEALFLAAEKIENKLESYSKEYQYWIEIFENNSFNDSIYIHTKNPNGSIFPVKLEFKKQTILSNPKLVEYLQKKAYIVQKKESIDDNKNTITKYFLQKENLGKKL